MRHQRKVYWDKNWLIDQHYTKRKKIEHIANELGVRRQTISNWMRKYGLKSIYPLGKEHPSWKGGRLVRKDNYIAVHVGQKDGKSVYELEHRLVVEKRIGRKLTRAEIVHHRDGNRQNNSYENLMLDTRSNHSAELNRNGYYDGYLDCALEFLAYAVTV